MVANSTLVGGNPARAATPERGSICKSHLRRNSPIGLSHRRVRHSSTFTLSGISVEWQPLTGTKTTAEAGVTHSIRLDRSHTLEALLTGYLWSPWRTLVEPDPPGAKCPPVELVASLRYLRSSCSWCPVGRHVAPCQDSLRSMRPMSSFRLTSVFIAKKTIR